MMTALHPDRSPAVAEPFEQLMPNDYLAMVAHDLRAPLTAVKLCASDLLTPSGAADETRRTRHLHRIAEAADRMARLIDDLLTAGQLEAPGFHPCRQRVNLGHLVRRVCSDAGIRYASRRFQIVIQQDQCLVDADPVLIGRVLDNLLDNAVTYSPDGSDVEVGVRVGDAPRNQWPASGSVNVIPRWGIFWVRDEGVGVPRDQVEHAFQQYARLGQPANRQVLSTGLGLYICWRIVRAHGGAIWANSQSGEGSTFCVGLPCVVSAMADAVTEPGCTRQRW